MSQRETKSYVCSSRRGTNSCTRVFQFSTVSYCNQRVIITTNVERYASKAAAISHHGSLFYLSWGQSRSGNEPYLLDNIYLESVTLCCRQHFKAHGFASQAQDEGFCHNSRPTGLRKCDRPFFDTLGCGSPDQNRTVPYLKPASKVKLIANYKVPSHRMHPCTRARFRENGDSLFARNLAGRDQQTCSFGIKVRGRGKVIEAERTSGTFGVYYLSTWHMRGNFFSNVPEVRLERRFCTFEAVIILYIWSAVAQTYFRYV